MLKVNIWNRQITRDRRRETFFISSPFPIIIILVALPLGLVLGRLDPILSVAITSVIVFAIIIVLRQFELAVTAVIVIRLYVDWYLGIGFAAQIVMVLLLAILFLSPTLRRSWGAPQPLWLWFLFLAISILPAIRGISLQDGAYYYFNVIFSAFIIYWIAIVIAQDFARVRLLFRILSFFGMLIAMHSIIQATTGTLLFGSSRFDAYLASINNYQLFKGEDAVRIGSFFVNPDLNGGFLAMMLFIPLGLFVESTIIREKVLYLIEAFIMLIALLFTYSSGAWSSVLAGVVVFLIFVGSARYRILLASVIFGVTMAMSFLFPSQINFLLRHAEAPNELALRTGAWQTGIGVISAFPLTGIGLGRYVYLERAEPYRVLAQYRPLDHPHNSWLEFAALGGLPIAIVFTALLSFTLWLAFRNWIRAGAKTRAMFGGGIASVIALSVYSLSDAGWTAAPLLAMGWLILGVVSSPIIAKNRNREMMKEEKR